MLRVRALQETEARGTYLEARAQAEAAQRDVESQNSVLEASREALLRMQSSARLSPLEVLGQHTAIEDLEASLTRTRRVATQSWEHSETMRSTWQERRAELRGLERLLELRRAVHTKELEREESREADERTLARESVSRFGPPEGTDRVLEAPPGSRSGGFRADEWTPPLVRTPLQRPARSSPDGGPHPQT